jgi:chromosome segregation ATPase
MLDTITIALIFLALLSLMLAVVAIGWLSRVRKHLSALGMRVLESEDIGRVIQAADKTASFESRMTGCESKADESQNQLMEHETKLSELAAKLGATEQMMDTHTTDLAQISEKMASFELRFDEFDNNVGEKLNQLLEYETKVNELATKLKSVEGMVNNNRAGHAEADQNIQTLADEIEILRKFQTTVEKTHSLIQAAFTDMRASTLSEEGLGITSETAEPEEASQEPEEWQ